MVELTVGYEGEDEQSKEKYLKDAVQKAEDDMMQCNPLEEVARKNYDSVGAESAKICGNSNLVADLTALVKDCKMSAYEAAIIMTPGKLQRGFYRILNKFGLFNPSKVFQKKIDSVDARITEMKNVCSNYEKKISDGIVQAKESELKMYSAMKIKAEIETKEYSDMFEKREAQNKIDVANEAIVERADELKCLEIKIEQYETVAKCINGMKKNQAYLLQCLKQLKDNANSNSDIAKLNKLGEAYGKI